MVVGAAGSGTRIDCAGEDQRQFTGNQNRRSVSGRGRIRKTSPSLRRSQNSERITGLGTNKNLVISSYGTQNQEYLRDLKL